MHEPPSTADLAYSQASDNDRELRVIAKRLELIRQVVTSEKPFTPDEFAKAWADAVPKPIVHQPIDYAELAKADPYYRPSSKLG